MSKREPLMDQNEVAEYLGVDVGTVENWRYKHRGPAYIKVERLVKYRPAAVEAYLNARTKSGSSSERAA